MEQTTELDLTGGWESIVNNVERHNARLRFDAKVYRLGLRKKLGKMTNLALGAILSVVLGFSGLLAPWLAGAIAVTLICCACILGGRIWEGYHKSIFNWRKTK